MQDNTKLQIKFYSRFSSTIQLHHKFITSHTKTKNEIQTRFSKWCENEKRSLNPFSKVMRKRKTKFISVFQSDAKTKNENWNSYPFFKVKQKRKKKYEVQIRFSKLSENEKQKAKFKSVFQCHAKTKNGNGTWIPFSHAIEKRLAPRYTHLKGPLIIPVIPLGRGGGVSNDWCINPLFKFMKKWQTKL